jgi:hypothetical protein
MVALWDDPVEHWDDHDIDWDGEQPLLQGILWVNDGGTWLRADDVHPYAREGVWKDPVEVWAQEGTRRYVAWPYYVTPVYPPLENLRVTANTSTSITVAWDAPTPAPIRYRVSWDGPGLIESGGMDNGLTTTATKSGLTVDSTYTVTVWAEYSDGNGEFATIIASTSASTPPSITSWTPRNYNTLDLVVAGTPPFTLRCSSGARAGNTYAWASAGAQVIGGMIGKEYWYIDNAGGSTARFWTDDGTPAQSGTTGAIRTSLLNPLPTYGRGSTTSIAWGDAPAFSAHASFPFSNINDGGGATRWQTGNYARGWLQHQIGVPSNYRVRRFMFVQGDGSSTTQMVTPVYSVDSGATFKRWSHFGGTWIPATDATVHPGTTSPNGLLSIDSQGNWNRDWNWQLGGTTQLTTPFIPENATNLSQRWIYIRWGIVHQTGSFGANCGECWMEYQEPSTPAVAEVKCTRGWG